MKFTIRVREVWLQSYEVEASSKKEALEKYLSQHMTSDDVKVVDDEFEFSHALNVNLGMVWEEGE